MATGKDGTRTERLKAALRDNLRRRKTQERVRAEGGRPEDAVPGPEAAPGPDETRT